MFDIIIVGAGPAGLTAALYACRANKNVLVLEAKSYGGQIINASKIENYPGIQNISGFDFATNLYNQVKSLGCNIKFEEVIKIDDDYNVITNKNIYSAKCIVLATGVNNRKLNIENENKYIGKGLSYCATCDGNFYKDKEVAVVGGGNTALEDSLYLSDIASFVYLIHRRDKFRGEEKYIEEVNKRNNIKTIFNSNITKINGDEYLDSIEIDNNGKKDIINISGLFIAIGQEPNNLRFNNVVELDNNGYIKSDDGIHTSNKNIYVAGDTRVKNLRQLTTAISDGAIVIDCILKEIFM